MAPVPALRELQQDLRRALLDPTLDAKQVLELTERILQLQRCTLPY